MPQYLKKLKKPEKPEKHFFGSDVPPEHKSSKYFERTKGERFESAGCRRSPVELRRGRGRR
jgi:hypothetical protein